MFDQNLPVQEGERGSGGSYRKTLKQNFQRDDEPGSQLFTTFFNNRVDIPRV